jgi:hypothetical protein
MVSILRQDIADLQLLLSHSSFGNSSYNNNNSSSSSHVNSVNPLVAVIVSRVVVRLGHVMKSVVNELSKLAQHRLIENFQKNDNLTSAAASAIGSLGTPYAVYQRSSLSISVINSKLSEVLAEMDRWSDLLEQRVNSLSTDSLVVLDQSNLERIESIRLISNSSLKTATAVANVIISIAKRMKNTGNGVLKLMQQDRLTLNLRSFPTKAESSLTTTVPADGNWKTPVVAPTGVYTMSLDGVNQQMASIVKSLDKWSRLLYEQTIVDGSVAAEDIDLTSLGQHDSSVKVANIIVKLAKRLRQVVRVVSGGLQEKFAARDDEILLSPTSTKVSSVL